MSKPNRIHIGTSGWIYRHWRGPFYPEDLPVARWFDFYARRFATVEVNNSFYRLPAETTFAAWREKSPDDFVFAVKASRFITHMKKLKDPDEPVSTFMRHAGLLGEKLGPVLFQLPPRWKVNPDRLQAFLQALPEGYRYAFEFRDPTWWSPATYALLRKHGAAFCLFELDRLQPPPQITADFVYVRLHGPDGAYAGQYDDISLSRWADLFREWAGKGKAVYCYFDNDQYGYAAQDALRLREMAARRSNP